MVSRLIPGMRRFLDWVLFACIFVFLILLTLVRGEDPRRDRPWGVR